MVTLPVSGLDVALRAPCGDDELALLEAPDDPARAGLALLSRLASRTDGAPQDWAQLTVTDFEVLLLALRRQLFGDRIDGRAACPGCGDAVEISFGVADYVAQVRPADATGVRAAAREGWMQLDGAAFRLPTVADVLAARAEADPTHALQRRCLAPGLATKTRRRIERALSRLAPQATGEVGGACPSCGALLAAWFDISAFVVAEARRLAAGLYQEAHLLASTYHWAEAAILALPAGRRRAYAEMIRDSRLGG